MSDLPTGPAWLFCPADRPERFAKAAAVADVVILDLEDGVSPAARGDARRALRSAAGELDPACTVVRVNAVDSPDHAADLDTVHESPFTSVMLAKTESAQQIGSLTGLNVIALCETARAVQALAEIAAAPACGALMWGAEDLMASLGGSSSRRPDGRYRDVAIHSRVSTLIAAASAGIAALDSVYLDIDDLDGLAAETADAVESGFAAKVCIHPRQVPVVRDAFRPSAASIARAQRMIAAAGNQDAHGVFALDGQMVDEPLLRQARRLLARAASGR